MKNDSQVVADYLDGEISLGKAAENLGVTRFALTERFESEGIPLRLGSESMDEARSEVEVARRRACS